MAKKPTKSIAPYGSCSGCFSKRLLAAGGGGRRHAAGGGEGGLPTTGAGLSGAAFAVGAALPGHEHPKKCQNPKFVFSAPLSLFVQLAQRLLRSMAPAPACLSLPAASYRDNMAVLAGGLVARRFW